MTGNLGRELSPNGERYLQGNLQGCFRASPNQARVFQFGGFGCNGPRRYRKNHFCNRERSDIFGNKHYDKRAKA